MTLGKFLAAALLIAASPVDAQTSGLEANYLLGPQDNLNIRVYSLRKNVGETYSWEALNGEFSVGANGAVLLPIVGELKAGGGTTAELAALISKTLRERAGLAEPPSASVEVLQYRPFYILGAVQQPGQYEFQPGLTVLRALSIAKGLVRAEDLAAVEREIVTAGGDLRVLGAERVALLAKIARLTAESSNAETITYPPELTENSTDPRIVDAMRQETLRFEVRRSALAAELKTIKDSQMFLEQELSTLKKKGEALDRQIEISQEELQVVSGLVDRGLAVTPRQRAAQSALTFVESNRLDVRVSILRAQQSLSRVNRDLVNLPAHRREEVIAELASAREALNENAERLRTAERLLQNASARSANVADRTELVAQFTVTRNDPSGPITIPVTETDALQPGDVLEVRLATDDGAASQLLSTRPASVAAIGNRSRSGEVRN